LPAIVFFDARCTYYIEAHIPGAVAEPSSPLRLGHESLAVQVQPHGNVVTLPNGKTIPIAPIAVSMPGSDGERPFYVLALFSVWQADPVASKDPYLSERILGVSLHEMTHTYQLPEVVRRTAELSKRASLPHSLDDDMIEDRFAAVPGFRSAFEEERDLFFRAALEQDPVRRRRLAVEALDKALARRQRYFTGSDEAYAELESMFLSMEGLAEWLRFHHYLGRHMNGWNDVQVIAFMRGKNNNWSQDEGLALFLLLERLGPVDWPEVLVKVMSPFQLLQTALAPGRGGK
jgi:hypothetical protein